jgi:ubiquinone/menaquinone biosynthesis C-methylase UbiE
MDNLVVAKTHADTIEQEYWRSTARHYDAGCAADARLRDIPFYLEVAKSVRGGVLEVGCGTGRVLLAVARAGVQVDGLDFSPDLPMS